MILWAAGVEQEYELNEEAHEVMRVCDKATTCKNIAKLAFEHHIIE